MHGPVFIPTHVVAEPSLARPRPARPSRV